MEAENKKKEAKPVNANDADTDNALKTMEDVNRA